MTASAYYPRPFEATFGYFSSACSTTEHMRKMHRTINLMNGFGVVPIIGTIVGIARIIFFSKFVPERQHCNQNEKVFSCLQITRGCFEVLSLGALFLIPDLIFTINRELEIEMRVGGWFSTSFGEFR